MDVLLKPPQTLQKALKTYADKNIPDNEVIICNQSYEKDYDRCYCLKFDELEEILGEKKERHIFELIHEKRKSRLVFDFDLEFENDERDYDTAFNQEKEKVISETHRFIDYLRSKITNKIENLQLIFLYSKGAEKHKKISFHIIVRLFDDEGDELYFENHFKAGKLIKEIFDEIKIKLFDIKIYSKNRWFRTIYSSKIERSDDFLVCDNENVSIKDTFITYLSDNHKEIEIIKKKKMKNVDVGEFEEDENDLKDILDNLNEERYQDRNLWLNVGYILKGIYYSNLEKGRDLYHYFSQKWDDYKEKDVDIAWNSLKREDYMRHNKTSLLSLLKLDNEEKYQEYSKKFIITIKNIDIDISRYFKTLYENEFVFDGNDYYYFENHKWNIDVNEMMVKRKLLTDFLNEIRYKLSQMINQKNNLVGIDEKELEKFEIRIKTLNDINIWIGNNRPLTTLSHELYDRRFIEKINKNTELILFNNGVYDLKQNIFRNGMTDDYMSISCKYDIDFDLDTKPIEDILGTIFPDDDLREYFINVLIYFLYSNKKQLFHVFFNETAGNGKSMFFDTLQKAFGDFMISGPVSLITKEYNSSSTANSSLISLKNKKLIRFDEPENGVKLNSAIIKTLTGNDLISARDLYKPQETFYITGNCMLVCNKIPKLGNFDGGIERRLRIVPFKTKFYDKNELQEETKFERWKKPEIFEDENLHIRLMVFLLKENKRRGGYNLDIIPDEIKFHTNSYFDDNRGDIDELEEMFDNNFKITDDENNYVQLKDIKEICKSCNVDYDQFLTTFRKRCNLDVSFKTLSGNVRFYERKMIDKRYLRNIFTSIKKD